MEQKKIDQPADTKDAAGNDAKADAPTPEAGATAKAAPAKKGGKAKKEASAKKDGAPAKTTTTPKAPVNNSLEKIGRDALKRNPSMRTVFVTTDGVPFGSASDAENHAKTLESKAVEIVTE